MCTALCFIHTLFSPSEGHMPSSLPRDLSKRQIAGKLENLTAFIIKEYWVVKSCFQIYIFRLMHFRLGVQERKPFMCTPACCPGLGSARNTTVKRTHGRSCAGMSGSSELMMPLWSGAAYKVLGAGMGPDRVNMDKPQCCLCKHIEWFTKKLLMKAECVSPTVSECCICHAG